MRARTTDNGIVRLYRGNAPLLALTLALGLVLILDIVWLLRFRWGYPTEWDESGYLAIGVRDANALTHHGVFSFARTFENQQTEAPLVPALAALVFAVFGSGMGQGVLVEFAFVLLLALATYAVGRTIMGRWWAVLAAVTVAAAPVVTDYSRIFHFSVPAAFFFTAALWALIRSDRLRERRFVVLCGLFLGLMVLARTMTVAYLPAIAVAALLQALGTRGPRRPLALNALLGVLAGCAVAGLWYVRSWRSVADYLRSSGYGADSSHFGASRPVFSIGFWTRIADTVTNNLYLPLTALVVFCLMLGVVQLAARWSGHRDAARLLRAVTAPWFVLVVVVVEGYLALTSSKNDGTAFALPWLPALVVLAVFAVSGLSRPAVRAALATAFAVLIVIGLAMKSGFVSPLAGVAAVHVPAIGSSTVVDGKGIVQASVVEASGYPPQPATTPLPDFQKGWPGFEQRVVRAIIAHERALPASGDLGGYVASDSQILSNTSFQFAAALLDDNVGFQWLSPFSGDTFRTRLSQPAVRFLLTAPTPLLSQSRQTLAPIIRAARATGYRAIVRFTMPDGRGAILWWRARA